MDLYDYKNRPRTRSKTTLKAETKKTTKALIITLSLMIVVLMGAFLSTTNQSAQKGYTLEQQKLKNEHLKTINVDLVTKITQATAFSQLKENNKLDNMQPPIDKKYVTNDDNKVE